MNEVNDFFKELKSNTENNIWLGQQESPSQQAEISDSKLNKNSTSLAINLEFIFDRALKIKFQNDFVQDAAKKYISHNQESNKNYITTYFS
jgi:hypothetical protein